MSKFSIITGFGCLLILVCRDHLLKGAEDLVFEDKYLEAFTPRPIGPANMGGRIVDIAVVENRPGIIFVATATGGLWKTSNNGTTWQALFDHESSASLGAVAVAPSNPEIVWVGTGEANLRNSVMWGNGVYKSTDGGKSWQNMGLKDSAHIGRVIIHPTNPEIVYVACLGHAWGPNKERGLYKTLDGGKTWQQANFINEETGFIDLAMDPRNPDILYAAAYQVRRDAFAGPNPAILTGPGSGLFKTMDAGKTWIRMKKGLPNRPLGRCGLAISRKDPSLVYAVIQTDKTASSISGQKAQSNNQIDIGGIFRSEDLGETWTKVNNLCPRPFYFGQIRIDPNDSQRIYVLGITLFVSNDGGKTFSEEGARVHPDQHALWIDPHDSGHLLLGNDGGIFCSYDQGRTWEFWNQIPIGQFYAVAVDNRTPYRVYGGLQDNGTWAGRSANHNPDGISNADWFRILGGDGFCCQVDPADPNTVYAEAQYGALHRIDLNSGDSWNIRPKPTRGNPAYRFNWNSPILVSPHDAHTLYYGANMLFRSANRGDDWEIISPDLTRGQPGPSPNTGHTITTIAESPIKPGLLYVGTDDGRVHVSKDGGISWTELSKNLAGLSPDRWITRLECSHAAEGTAYLTLDRSRNEDRAPYLFRTEDYGASWEPLVKGLPTEGPIQVIREDPHNPNLLFLGTGAGLFLSVDRGQRWHPFGNGLPTAPVHDLVIQPRDRELVIGTHGRSIYILDIAPLEELTPKVLQADAYLFEAKPATAFTFRGTRGWMGNKYYSAPNPPYGGIFYYYLKIKPDMPVNFTVTNKSGKKVFEWKGTQTAGFHQLTWNLQVKSEEDETLADPGEYAIHLKVGDIVRTRKFRVVAEE